MNLVQLQVLRPHARARAHAQQSCDRFVFHGHSNKKKNSTMPPCITNCLFCCSDVSGGTTGCRCCLFAWHCRCCLFVWHCRCCLFAWHCRCPGPPYLVQCGPHFTPTLPQSHRKYRISRRPPPPPPAPPGELGGPRAPRALAIRSDQLDRWGCVWGGGGGRYDGGLTGGQGMVTVRQ